MKPTVYVEKTVPSYRTAWPSRDVVRAGEQQLTRDWWARRSGYELRVSSLVLLECQAGHPDAAAQRLAALAGVPGSLFPELFLGFWRELEDKRHGCPRVGRWLYGP